MASSDSPTLTSIRRNAVLVPKVSISVTSPGNEVTTLTLGLAPVVIGSAPECDLVIDDASVSRRHCELRLSERGTHLRDLGSKNGTIVNGTAVIEAMIDTRSDVVFGGHHLRIAVEGAPAEVPLVSAARFGDALGGSVGMRALFARLAHVATTPETILVSGESGTGKEVLAHAIHAASPRAGKPFVVFDCSAIAPNLADGTLFGYVKGAFTGAVAAHEGLVEQADGGTLFIDELGELPLELQPKLLRVLESRQVRRLGESAWRNVDVRLIAATHRDLRARVREGTFREDLFYRLAVVEMKVPPLRERKDDIPLLAERFLQALTPPRYLSDLSANTMAMLMGHDWPGNVRELRNTITRLALFPDLGKDALAPVAASEGRAPGGSWEPFLELPMHEARDLLLEQFEKRYVVAKLQQAGGNVTKAAELMGVSRQFVYRLMERCGVRNRDEG